MSKLSIGRIVQITAFSFGVSALVLSAACAPARNKAVPVTKMDVEDFKQKAARTAQKAFPDFQCTSPDAIDLSNRINGASVEVVNHDSVDPVATGPVAAYDVLLKIIITAPDKSVYAMSASGLIVNDGKHVPLKVDPTTYPAHPEGSYTFEAACKMTNGRCLTVIVKVREEASSLSAAVAAAPAPVAAPVVASAPVVDKEKDEGDDTPEKEAASDSAPIVAPAPTSGQTAATSAVHVTVIMLHANVPNISRSPKAGSQPSPVDTSNSSVNLKSNSVVLDMFWRPGPPVGGRCGTNPNANSFDRAAQGLGPASPFKSPPIAASGPAPAPAPAPDDEKEEGTKEKSKDPVVLEESEGDGPETKTPPPAVPGDVAAPAAASAPVAAPVAASGPAVPPPPIVSGR